MDVPGFVPLRDVLREANVHGPHLHLEDVHHGDASDRLAVARIDPEHLFRRVDRDRCARRHHLLDRLLGRRDELCVQ